MPKAFKNYKGTELIDKVIDIDQSPIGRTPRSNPATYTELLDQLEIGSLICLTLRLEVINQAGTLLM